MPGVGGTTGLQHDDGTVIDLLEVSGVLGRGDPVVPVARAQPAPNDLAVLTEALEGYEGYGS